MDNLSLHIIPCSLLAAYKKQASSNISERFALLKDSPLSVETFSFYTSVSAVFSSKIEGEDIELDSFIKHKRFGAQFQPDHTRKIDDLYDAYMFAQQNQLTASNFYDTHALLTRNILQPSRQGKIRTGNMYVLTKEGNIEYVAAAPALVPAEMEKLFKDIRLLLHAQLTTQEVFYFAAMLHLVFVKIHPFEDGNGRMGRLLEKWFLACKLGANAWFLASERYYYEHHATYYNNIRKLGLEYNELNYEAAAPFLLMLPASLQ